MYKQYFYHKIDSTQLEIWRRIEENKIDNKTVVIADIQTNGKGTHGRKWYTDEVNNIAFSFFLNQSIGIDFLSLLFINSFIFLLCTRYISFNSLNSTI